MISMGDKTSVDTNTTALLLINAPTSEGRITLA